MNSTRIKSCPKFYTMRRSAAPSVRAAKKMKFCAPFLAGSRGITTGNSTSAATTSVLRLSDPVRFVRKYSLKILFALFLGRLFEICVRKVVRMTEGIKRKLDPFYCIYLLSFNFVLVQFGVLLCSGVWPW